MFEERGSTEERAAAAGGIMRIILDGMGGDNAPAEIVKGAVEAASVIDHTIIIVGQEEMINAELAKAGYSGGNIIVEDARDVITNEDKPVNAVRKKKDSSMVKGLEMVANGEGDLFVSAGNTGALLAGSLFILGRIEGIDRPALASVYPVMGGTPALLLDAGANAECKPGNLLDFAKMGSIYAERVMGKDDPRVGLVNIGAEDGKGNSLTKAAFNLIGKSDLNFVGNVEARYLTDGVCDVIVCDGFTGNVVLKLTEGVAMSLFGLIKDKLTSSTFAKIGAAVLRGKFKELKDEFDYTEYGGAPVLGVKKPAIKMHGSSNANAVKNAIKYGITYAENKVVEIIADSVDMIEEIKTGD